MLIFQQILNKLKNIYYNEVINTNFGVEEKMRKPIQFHWKATHHLYIGIIITLYSLLSFEYAEINIFENNLFILGFYFMMDDIIEHTITASTPLRIITEKVLDPVYYKIFPAKSF